MSLIQKADSKNAIFSSLYYILLVLLVTFGIWTIRVHSIVYRYIDIDVNIDRDRDREK